MPCRIALARRRILGRLFTAQAAKRSCPGQSRQRGPARCAELNRGRRDSAANVRTARACRSSSAHLAAGQWHCRNPQRHHRQGRRRGAPPWDRTLGAPAQDNPGMPLRSTRRTQRWHGRRCRRHRSHQNPEEPPDRWSHRHCRSHPNQERPQGFNVFSFPPTVRAHFSGV